MMHIISTSKVDKILTVELSLSVLPLTAAPSVFLCPPLDLGLLLTAPAPPEAPNMAANPGVPPPLLGVVCFPTTDDLLLLGRLPDLPGLGGRLEAAFDEEEVGRAPLDDPGRGLVVDICEPVRLSPRSPTLDMLDQGLSFALALWRN